MKKLIAVIMSITVLGLCACGDINEEGAASGSSEIYSETSSAAANDVSDAAEKKQEERTIELDLSDSEKPQITKVCLSGDIGRGASLENVYGIDIVSSELTGLFGCPVEVELDGESGLLSFEVDTGNMDNVPIENLIVLCKNSDDNDDYQQVKSTLSGNVITAQIQKSDIYMLADCYQWFSAWGMDMSEYAHDTVWTNDEFSFSFSLPAGISCSEVSDYWSAQWRSDVELVEIMEKSLIHQNSSKEAAMTVSLSAVRFPDDEDDCINPAPQQELDEVTDQIISSFSNSENYPCQIEPKQTMELLEDRKGYLLKIYAPDNTSIGIREQSTVTGYYEYSEDTYIVLSYFMWGADEELLKKAEDSVKSFKFTDTAKTNKITYNNNTDDIDRYGSAELSETDSGILFNCEGMSFSMDIPDGYKCDIMDCKTEENDIGEKVTDLIEITSDSLYNGTVYDISDRYTAYMDANGMYNLYEKTVADYTAIKRDEYDMTNGGTAYVMMVSRDKKTGYFDDENGVYDFYGFYETGASDVYTCISFTINKNSS